MHVFTYTYITEPSPRPQMLNREHLKAIFYYISCLIVSCIFNFEGMCSGSDEVCSSTNMRALLVSGVLLTACEPFGTKAGYKYRHLHIIFVIVGVTFL